MEKFKRMFGAAAEKWRGCCDGLFSFTNSWVFGRPVYYNVDGNMLYLYYGGIWMVGPEFGKNWMTSTFGPLLPTNAKFWNYWDGEIDRTAQVVLSCL